MSYGLHWEWRGFGRLDPSIRDRIERLRPAGAVSRVVDCYAWWPGIAINFKLRSWPGGHSLKLKRLLRRNETLDVELWEERPNEEYLLPILPETLHSVFADLAWEHVRVNGPVDRASLEDLLVHAAPGVRLISVTKRRRAYTIVHEQIPVRVELAEITDPEELTSVGIEDESGLDEGSSDDLSAHGRDAVCAVRDGLGVSLESRSYLDALAYWARGARLVRDSW